MRFLIDDLEVLFPFDHIYPEQLAYMRSLKQTLGNGHAVLEMPTGTGKTITLLSLLLSYQYKFPEVGKIVYCTRTVHEMTKVLEELKVLSAYRERVIAEDQRVFEQKYPDVAQKARQVMLSVGISAQRQHDQLLEEQAEAKRLQEQQMYQTHTSSSLQQQQQQHQHQQQPRQQQQQQQSSLLSIDEKKEGILSSTPDDSKIEPKTTSSLQEEADLSDNILADLGLLDSPFTDRADRNNRGNLPTIDSDEQFTMPGSLDLTTTKGIKRKRPNEDAVKTEDPTAMDDGDGSQQPPPHRHPARIGIDTSTPSPLPSSTSTIATATTSSTSSTNNMTPGSIAFELEAGVTSTSALRSYIVKESIDALVRMGVDELLAIQAVGIFRSPNILGVCLSARTNMCIHDVIGQFTHKDKVDAMCRSKTASYIRDSVFRKIMRDRKRGYPSSTSSISSNAINSNRTDGDIAQFHVTGRVPVVVRSDDGDDDDDIPPPLQPNDEFLNNNDNISSSTTTTTASTATTTTSSSSSTTTTTTASNIDQATGLPCASCKHGPAHGYTPTSTSTSTSTPSASTPAPVKQEVVMDIESIGQEGLCPYYEGYIAITGNQRGPRHTTPTTASTASLSSMGDDDSDDHLNMTLRVVNTKEQAQQLSNSSSVQQQQQTSPSTSSSPSTEGGVPTSGVFTIKDLIEFGRQYNVCPYYLTRHLMDTAHVVVFNYHYLIDPKISAIVSRNIEKESVVVFDEAHNIDNICIEVYSITLSKNDVHASSRILTKLRNLVQQQEDTNAQQLQTEYQRIMSGLLSSLNTPQTVPNEIREEMNELLASPLPDFNLLLQNDKEGQNLLRKTLPGSIRRGRNFVLFLKTLVEFLKTRLTKTTFSQHTTEGFLREFQHEVLFHDISACKYSYDRLSMLLNTLEIVDFEDYLPLIKLTSFITLISNFQDGFVVLFEPVDDNGVPDPRLQLCCVDSSLAMKPLFEKFSSVIITSGTLSPLDMYPRMLNFTPFVSESFSMSLNRRMVLPLIVTKGSDLTDISTAYADREKKSILSSYGNMLISLAKTVPDGMVVFFTSYAYMEHVLTSWHQDVHGPKSKPTTVIQELLKHKLIFVETKDIEETTIALAAYKKACSNGRGAILFSIARGKVSEGIDFSGHLGRCVVLIGVPYQYTRSRVLLARLEYLRTHLNIPEEDFLHFDALRQTAQCLGRIVRSKADYGVMVLADKRYSRLDVRQKLPRWIQNFIDTENQSLSIDSAVASARHFFKTMSTPYNLKYNYGTILLNQNEAISHIRMLENASNNNSRHNSTSVSTGNTTGSMPDQRIVLHDGDKPLPQVAYRYKAGQERG